MYDLIEWIAKQPWCDGNVGMVGISAFGGAQFEAAAQQPPSLKAIFPYDFTLAPGQRCASTSNRNFEGRQGYKGRTHLVSPAMAAAAAIAGHFVDVRKWN